MPTELASEEVIVMAHQLQEAVGTLMIDLSLIAHDNEQQLFALVEEFFPNLASLTILLTGYRATPFEDLDLSYQVSQCRHCPNPPELTGLLPPLGCRASCSFLLSQVNTTQHADLGAFGRLSWRLGSRLELPGATPRS